MRSCAVRYGVRLPALLGSQYDAALQEDHCWRLHFAEVCVSAGEGLDSGAANH
jgi:hypothetical protein